VSYALGLYIVAQRIEMSAPIRGSPPRPPRQEIKQEKKPAKEVKKPAKEVKKPAKEVKKPAKE